MGKYARRPALESVVNVSGTRREFIKRSALLGGGLIVGPTLLAACADDSDSGDDGGPQSVKEVQIGLVLPMTGAAAAYGKAGYDAVTLVFDDVNSKGGIKSLGGAKLKAVLKDSATDPQKAASVTQEFVDTDVLAIMGTIQSDATSVAAPVAERAQVPWICTSDGARQILKRGGKYVFMPAAFSADAAINTAAWIAQQSPQPTKVRILHGDSAVAAEIGEALETECKKAGLPLDGREIYSQADVNTARPLVLQAKSDGVDLLIAYGYTPPDSIALTRFIEESRLNPLGIVAASGGIGSAAYGAELGASADGSATTTYFVADMGSKIPRVKELNDMYKAKTGSDLDIVSATNVNAAAVVVDALERAAGASRGALRDAIAETDLDVGEGYWTGLGGCKFDETNHNAAMIYPVMQWQDGVAKVVYPEEYATVDSIWPLQAGS